MENPHTKRVAFLYGRLNMQNRQDRGFWKSLLSLPVERTLLRAVSASGGKPSENQGLFLYSFSAYISWSNRSQRRNNSM